MGEILVGRKEAFITSSTIVPATGSTQIAPEVKFEDVGNSLNEAIKKMQLSSTHEYFPSFKELFNAYRKLGFEVSFTFFKDLSK